MMASSLIKVNGMTCGGCANSVKRALLELSGVEQVEVSLDKACASIDYDPSQVTPLKLKQVIDDAGFEAIL